MGYGIVAREGNLTPDGIGIVDVERPEQPKLSQMFNDGGKINDTNDVKVGMTNASQFAYVADGHNGLRVIQLMSPETPGYTGFSPRPRPDLPEHGLIATYPTRGPAVALSRGLDRDRRGSQRRRDCEGTRRPGGV